MLRCTRLSRRGDSFSKASWIRCKLLSIWVPEGPIPLSGAWLSGSHTASIFSHSYAFRLWQTRSPSRISPSLWLFRGWIPPWQQELKSKYSHSRESMVIFHCMFIERSLPRKGVFHSFFFRYSTMVAVLGCGHSCLAVACSCI